MEEKYTWKVEDIFNTEEDFLKAIAEVEKFSKEVSKYKGTLKDVETIYKFLEEEDTAGRILELAYAYAMLKHHEDTSNSENRKRYNKVLDLSDKVSIASAFVIPELQKLSVEELQNLLKQDERMKKYKRDIEYLIEVKPHILDDAEEALLSKVRSTFGYCNTIFDTLTDTNFIYPSITTKNGEKLELTHGSYSMFLESKDRDIRKQAFENLYSVYEQFNETLATIYLNDVKGKDTLAKIKKFPNALEKTLFYEYSNLDVYNKLIETTNKNMHINHRYMKLRKKQLGVEKLHMYDMGVDITAQDEEKITYEEAKEIVKNTISVMGEEYSKMINTALEERWIHVYEQKAKRSGAYSMGVYGVHPFVLLNHMDNIDSVSTLAHELGHAMHSYYSSSAQTYNNSDYKLMVAEVASTVNETLLAEYLINKETDKVKKASLLNTNINRIRATLIRQTMFAEFEQIVHTKVANGEQLTSEDLNKINYELNKKYFGEDVEIDEQIKYEWSRIPHYYSSFYVYKYATGISSAIAIAKKILAKEEGFVEKYIDMLRMGGSVKPLEQLKSVGVDLTTEKPVQDAFDYLNEKLEELEELMK